MMLRWIPRLIIALLVLPIAAGLVLALLPAFGYLPVLGGTHFSLQHWHDLLQAPGIWRSIGVSYFSGLLTTLVSLIVVLCFLAGFSGSRFDRWIRRLISPLLSLPHAAAAFGLAFLIAPAGLIARWISPALSGWQRPPDLMIGQDAWGVSLMAGLIIKEIPFLLLMAFAALPQVNPGQSVMLARSLGYRPRLAWFKVVAPRLYPLLRLPVYAVLAYASSSVDVAMILGPTMPPTLSVQVVSWFNDPDLSMHFLASAGAIAQLLVTLALLSSWWLLEQLVAGVLAMWIAGGGRRRGEGLIGLFGNGSMSLAVLVAALALFALLLNSVAGLWRFPAAWPNRLSLNNWLHALPSLVGPVTTSLLIAAVSTLLATVLALTALEREQRVGGRPAWALWLLYLPLLVPQVAFLSGLTVAGVYFSVGSEWWLVMLGHLLFVLPYVFLTLSEAYRRLDPRWSHVANALGASGNATFWRVRLPLLLAPILTAVALGLAISISQYLPTQLLGAGRISTVTTEAVALSSGGDRRLIGVWALVQAALPMLGFMVALLVPRLLWHNRRGMREVH
jgi:putative thiamine transport system permease protein